MDRKKICGEGSPCLKVKLGEAEKYFPVGPPYLLHHNDFRRLAPVWRESKAARETRASTGAERRSTFERKRWTLVPPRFAPRVYAAEPGLLAEMYAYCMAAAHLEMRRGPRPWKGRVKTTSSSTRVEERSRAFASCKSQCPIRSR